MWWWAALVWLLLLLFFVVVVTPPRLFLPPPSVVMVPTMSLLTDSAWGDPWCTSGFGLAAAEAAALRIQVRNVTDAARMKKLLPLCVYSCARGLCVEEERPSSGRPVRGHQSHHITLKTYLKLLWKKAAIEFCWQNKTKKK